MESRIITRGDPGESVLAPLQDRLSYQVIDRRPGRVVMPAPDMAPEEVELELEDGGEWRKAKLPKKKRRPGQYLGVWSGHGDGRGQVRPVSARFRQATISVAGQILGPFSGPCVVEGVEIYSANTELSPADSWSVLRVDFSATPGLQTLVFSSTGPPTGYEREGLTLFDQATFAGAGETTIGLQPGWFPWAPAVAGGTISAAFSTALYVPYQPLFIKVYCQNDAAAALTLLVTVLLRWWDEDEVAHNGLLRSGEEQIVYPRMRRVA